MEKTVARFLATSTAALALALPVQAQAEALGTHPAVIVAARGAGPYDYAAKFYPHPARLELVAHAPHAGAEHPAVLVARTWHNRGIDPNYFIPAHPARLELLAHAPHAGAEHPAVLVARTWHNRGIDPNYFIPAHPVRLEFARPDTGSEGDRPALAHRSRL